MTVPIPHFDGHNDFLLRLLRNPESRATTWLDGNGKGHLDLPRMQSAGFRGGIFAIYIPSPTAHDDPDLEALMAKPPYDLPLPKLISASDAGPIATVMAGHLLWMERASNGAFKICRSAPELRHTIAQGVIGAIMHMEGAEAIGPDLDALHLWHQAGLRSLGPVWSRPTIFGHGVPFRFPGSPDTGPGLTPAGRALINECNALNIMVDLSHLNEKGFDDVAALTTAPMVATHSNAHAITPSTRNLTDRQLSIIAQTNGVVGLNYAVSFLHEDGRKDANLSWETILRHMDHLLKFLGEDGVALGSDFDGATIPNKIGDVTGVGAFQAAMLAHGYGKDLVQKISIDNWLSLLDRTI